MYYHCYFVNIKIILNFKRIRNMYFPNYTHTFWDLRGELYCSRLPGCSLVKRKAKQYPLLWVSFLPPFPFLWLVALQQFSLWMCGRLSQYNRSFPIRVHSTTGISEQRLPWTIGLHVWCYSRTSFSHSAEGLWVAFSVFCAELNMEFRTW